MVWYSLKQEREATESEKLSQSLLISPEKTPKVISYFCSEFV